MDSFIFNSFKQRLLEADVPKQDTWSFYPVNTKFSEEYENKLPYLKNTSDIGFFGEEPRDFDFTSMDNNPYRTTLYTKTYSYNSMFELDNPSEPRYVTLDTFDEFNEETNNTQTHLKELFFVSPDESAGAGKFYSVDYVKDNGTKVPKGFYYVKTAEELLWCANKVNGINYDNKINIVLGDNIGNLIDNDNITVDNIAEHELDLKRITFCIGSNPAQPFEGVFYGNGFKLVNIELICNNDVNGIIGYLGIEGKISTVAIDGFNIIKCNKKINIDHLCNYGTNVYASLLCGKNNGVIENILVEGITVFYDFIPSMYSIKNKTDIEDNDGSNAGMYYPDYYCYDSIGNIVPYIGYFNEGVFGTYSGYSNGINYYYWNTHINHDTEIKTLSDSYISPLEWYYWNGLSMNEYDGYYMHFTREADRVNILWYDSGIIDNINMLEGLPNGGAAISDNGLFPCNVENLDEPDSMRILKYALYLNQSIKLSQQNRLAYYVSPVIGMNNSNVSNIRINNSIYTSGTFVGFIGGVAGMQANGILSNIKTNVSSYDVFADQEDWDKCYYKRQFVSTKDFNFPKKSIKNISSLFGSCIVGNMDSLKLNSVYSHLMNYNNIIFNGNKDNPIYDDYYFLNKFGALAAVVEYNTSNISDIWYNKIDLNDIEKRSINITDSYFGYDEDISKNNSYTGNVILQKPYSIEIDDFVVPKDEYRNMYGVASPLIAEIKPVYQAIPSIITTLYPNIAHYVAKSPDDITKYYRVGLFTTDQNLASPYSNINFQGIDLEVDLPGVANGYYDEDGNPTDFTYAAAAGGVVDRLNNSAGLNFDLDIRNIASKLIYWENSYTVNNTLNIQSPVTTIKVPGKAFIEPAVYATKVNSAGYADMSTTGLCNGSNDIPDNAIVIEPSEGTVYGYAANKVINRYSYFGSDLELIPNVSNGQTDLSVFDKPVKYQMDLSNPVFYPNNFEKFGLSADSPMINKAYTYFWGSDETGDDPSIYEYNAKVANNVKKVRIVLDPEAFNYQPFTDNVLDADKIDDFYNIKALVSDENGNKTNKIYSGWQTPIRDKNGRSIIDLAGYFGSGYNTKIKEKYNNLDITSGFVFLVDSSNYYSVNYSDDNIYGWDEVSARLRNYFVVPFNIKDYDIDSVGANPPYSNFEGFYVMTSALYASITYTAIDGTTGTVLSAFRPESVVGFMNYFDDIDYIEKGITTGIYPNKKRNYLSVISAGPVIPKKYFVGLDENNEPVYQSEKPELETRYLTAYRWTYNDHEPYGEQTTRGFWGNTYFQIHNNRYQPTPVPGTIDNEYYNAVAVTGNMVQGYEKELEISAYRYKNEEQSLNPPRIIKKSVNSNNYISNNTTNDIRTRIPSDYEGTKKFKDKYQCYGHIYPDEYWTDYIHRGPLTYTDKGFEISAFTDIPSALYEFRIEVSAVPLSGIPEAAWNWQTDWDAGFRDAEGEKIDNVISNYIRTGNKKYARPYDYEYTTLSYKVSSGNSGIPIVIDEFDVSSLNAIIPQSWLEQDEVAGRFTNNLLDSNDNNVEGLDISTDANVFSPLDFSAILYEDATIEEKDAIINNINQSEKISANNEIVDWFKYTYNKSENPSEVDKIDFNVIFDVKNNKRGFWFSYADYLGKPVSGDYEYNDELNYYSNILAIGKSLSENAIIRKCLQTDGRKWNISGFSANDFDGLYVIDSEKRPVMYIDVGLGECTDGTSWSLSSYPSIPEFSAFSAKLENELSGVIPTDIYNDYINLTEDKKLYSAGILWISAMNNCSGLLLEIE